MTFQSLSIVAVSAQYVWDVIESAIRSGCDPVCVDNLGGADLALPNLTEESSVSDRSVAFAIGTGYSEARRATAVAVHAAGWTNPVSLVDKTSTLAGSAALAHGAYVNAGVVVGALARLGCFANINRAASIGHHTMIGNFAHVGPGATLAGEITIGAGAFIGAGAVVLPRLSIGEGAIVGAGAVVTKDVPPFTTVIGSPARVLKIAKEWETTCPYCETN
jgi:sugar O-acyltransferase (sialic acid O-acetyltransferase NeuD family)